uniref:40S ribosomal protein S8 n=1 Tax=Lotharella vacuolata TaxID=74820 RepID=A0A0H5BH15_9EUKA|nr:ribosomal protein S8 [Lotharella vacuolata]
MGISRSSLYKRKLTGAKRKKYKKKRNYNKGRKSIEPKLSKSNSIKFYKVRGGNFKFRAIKLNFGNFSWKSLMLNSRAKILATVKNITSDRLAKKRFLYKNTIVKIDSKPFKFLLSTSFDKLKSTYFKKVDNLLIINFINRGYLYARITSRPGQVGSVSGIILEREEILFLIKKKEYKHFL